MLRTVSVFIVSLIAMTSATAGTGGRRDEWVVIDTKYTYPALAERLEAAVRAEQMGLVTSATALQGAEAAGFDVPDNKVFDLPLPQLRFCELQKLEEGRL